MPIRSYRQFCGLARALDIVGDRWALLIIRELLISPRRFTDLREALPGVASNLLADRLRGLAKEGVVASRLIPAPTPAKLYELTALGRDLEAAVLALTKWGGHRMLTGMRGDAFRPDWLVIAFRALLQERIWTKALRMRFMVEGVSILVQGGATGTSVGTDTASTADLEVTTDGQTALAIASGHLSLDRAAASHRCSITGTRRAIRHATSALALERAA